MMSPTMITEDTMKKQYSFTFAFVVLMILVSPFTGCVSKQWDAVSGVVYRVEVSRVIDGDTISVILPDGSTGTIRFLGVDAPELSPESNNPFEYEGITDVYCLASYGMIAKSDVTDLLLDEQIDIEFDASAGSKDVFDRWLAYIYLTNGSDFNELLLKQGYAQVYTKQTFSKKDVYLSLQEEAMKNHTGLWSCSIIESSSLYISSVHYDALGDDRTNLNDEYVQITYTGNTTGSDSIELTGCMLKDDDGTQFSFPTGFYLYNGQTITIYTGSGESTQSELFWGSTTPIWNNEEDTAYLLDDSGNLLDLYTWG
jgi:micrococcal nuclease